MFRSAAQDVLLAFIGVSAAIVILAEPLSRLEGYWFPVAEVHKFHIVGPPELDPLRTIVKFELTKVRNCNFEKLVVDLVGQSTKTRLVAIPNPTDPTPARALKAGDTITSREWIIPHPPEFIGATQGFFLFRCHWLWDNLTRAY